MSASQNSTTAATSTPSTSSLTSSSATEPAPSSSAPVATPSSAPVSVPSSTPAPSSTPPPPSATPAPSSTPPPSSSAAPLPSSSSTPPPASSSAPAPKTSIVTASSEAPETIVFTSLVTPSATVSGETPVPSVVIVTIVSTAPAGSQVTGKDASSTASNSATNSPTTLADIQNKNNSSGLGTGGKTAIAVVVPVVVVALLVLAGILLWRKRKQRKIAEEARRKEVEEYGFNPNHDPTLPAVGMQSEMAEDQSGYRGWGNTANSSNRKASTTLNSGMAYSDSNSNPGGYQSPNSPTAGGSDGHSADPLMNGRRETLDSEGIGALGAAPVASQNQAGVHRGPSNASSSYSAAGHSDNSGEYPLPNHNPQDYYDSNAYYAPNPYDNNGYGGGGQPIIRDVSARRNTRIENPSVFPQQGNSGIAQNF